MLKNSKTTVYYRSNFKIQNALALSLHKWLHVICCIYDLDTKTVSNQNVFKTKVAQNFKIFSFITYCNFTFVHPHKYLRRIHSTYDSETEMSLRQKIRFEYKHCSKFYNLKLYCMTIFFKKMIKQILQQETANITKKDSSISIPNLKSRVMSIESPNIS